VAVMPSRCVAVCVLVVERGELDQMIFGITLLLHVCMGFPLQLLLEH